ncbi:MAG: alpha/beta hydrolase [Solirubrobacteraceae bacterium]
MAAFEHVFERGLSDWTLLLLHGTGGDERDVLGLGRATAPHASLLSPRGQVSENGMARFFRRLAVGQLDIPDLLARTDELAEFVSQSVAAHGLDPARLVAVGLSNGANIAVSLLLRHPGLLRGAVLLRPMLPYEPEQRPALAGTAVLIAAGERDPYSPARQSERLADVLGEAGADVLRRVERGAGHELREGDLRAAEAWMTALMATD